MGTVRSGMYIGYIQTCNTWDLLGGDLGFGNQQLIGVVAFHDRWLHFHSQGWVAF